MNIYYQNLGASQMVTGSCHKLSIKNIEGEKDLNILIDFGQVQDGKLSFSQLYKINGRAFPFDFKEIDTIFLTHGHSDHVGLLGRLPFLGYKNDIKATQLTSELARENLKDGCFLHNKEICKYNKRKKNEIYEPLYTNDSVDEILSRLKGYSYNSEIVLNSKVKATFISNGHIGGSASILFTIQEEYSSRKILFSGDTSGLKEIPFTMKPKGLEGMKINTIITEHTYGDRVIPKVDVVNELEKNIQETCIQNKKRILVPSFSIGRCTNILYYLKEVYKKNPQFNKIRIYLMSPMATRCHNLLGRKDNFVFYDDKWKDHIDLWNWSQISYIDNFEELQSQVRDTAPCIYVASSGMLTGGYSQYIMTQLLPKKKNKLLFCGYQGERTNGRKLLEGEQKTITVEEDGKKKKLNIKADIGMIQGMSSHADYKDLIKFYSTFDKKKIKNFILTHGDKECGEFFKDRLNENFNAKVYIPKYGDVIKL